MPNLLVAILLNIGMLVSFSATASQRVELASLCQALEGYWVGDSAQPQGEVVASSVKGLCSADGQQLMLYVSAKHPSAATEAWWFRQQGDEVLLTFYAGEDEDKQQRFTLYQQATSYTLLGEGQRLSRPALIQLRFDRQATGWLWRQSVMYLDDDSDQYQLFRGISLQQAKP